MSSPLLLFAFLCISPFFVSDGSVCQRVDVRIWDGDSFTVDFDRTSKNIRIENIDAPEMKGRCGFENRLARRSKRRLGALLSGAKLELYGDRMDRYGRFLVRVLVDDLDVGEVLIDEGLARKWVGFRKPWC